MLRKSFHNQFFHGAWMLQKEEQEEEEEDEEEEEKEEETHGPSS